MRKYKKIPLPIFQNLSGAYLALGFVVAFINSFVLGLDVLNGWLFVVYTSMASLLLSVIILFVMFSTKYYRKCSKKEKWPIVTLVVSSFIITGNMLLLNGLGHVANAWLSTGDAFYADAVITSKTRIGYKQYIPHLTVRVNDSSGEKRVSKELWMKYNVGDIVKVRLKEGSLGYTNIVQIL